MKQHYWYDDNVDQDMNICVNLDAAASVLHAVYQAMQTLPCTNQVSLSPAKKQELQ